MAKSDTGQESAEQDILRQDGTEHRRAKQSTPKQGGARKRVVVFAAGGTGGHIIPALAVASALLNLDCAVEPLFIGTGKEIERKLYTEAKFRSLHLPSLPLRGRGILGAIKLAFSLPRIFLRAVGALRRERVVAVIGFGGYPSFLPLLAAFFLRIPRVIQEQNVQVGIANKVLSLIAHRVFAVPGARSFPVREKVCEVPNPVRDLFLHLPEFQIPKDRCRVLVLGGSQGAVSVNDGVLGLVPLFREFGVQLVHQTGERDHARMVAAYQAAGFSPVRVVPFMKNVAEELGEAHIVLSRAGAMSVAEITAAGRPAIYIPLNIAGAHQRWNCDRLVALGAARLVDQDENFVEQLSQTLRSLLKDPNQLATMSSAALSASRSGTDNPATTIAKAIHSLLP